MHARVLMKEGLLTQKLPYGQATVTKREFACRLACLDPKKFKQILKKHSKQFLGMEMMIDIKLALIKLKEQYDNKYWMDMSEKYESVEDVLREAAGIPTLFEWILKVRGGEFWPKLDNWITAAKTASNKQKENN